MFIPSSYEAKAVRLSFYYNDCQVSVASVARLSLAGQGSAVPCSSPAGWQFGVEGSDAPPSAPSHPPTAPAEPWFPFREQRVTQCQQLTQANLPQRRVTKAAENRRVILGSLSEGLC